MVKVICDRSHEICKDCKREPTGKEVGLTGDTFAEERLYGQYFLLEGVIGLTKYARIVIQKELRRMLSSMQDVLREDSDRES